jgi:predicted peptidase
LRFNIFDEKRRLVVSDYFDFADASDSVKIYIEFYVPKDASVGNKSFLISYEASVY